MLYVTVALGVMDTSGVGRNGTLLAMYTGKLWLTYRDGPQVVRVGQSRFHNNAVTPVGRAGGARRAVLRGRGLGRIEVARIPRVYRYRGGHKGCGESNDTLDNSRVAETVPAQTAIDAASPAAISDMPVRAPRERRRAQARKCSFILLLRMSNWGARRTCGAHLSQT